MRNQPSDTGSCISRIQEQDWVSRFLLVIEQKIVKDYDVSLDVAAQAVNDSGMEELCHDLPGFVARYPASHWAKAIYETRIKRD